MVKNIITAVIVSVIICVLFLAGFSAQPAQAPTLGGDIKPTLQQFTGGLKLGFDGTSVNQIIEGTCNLSGGTINATSSGIGACAVSGVRAGDLVFVELATSSASGAVVGASASTTAGWIAVKILNLSGANATVSAFGSSTQYVIVR